MLLQKYVSVASSVSRKRETESCTVIGYSSEQDGALVPAVFPKKMAFFYHEIYFLLIKHEFKMTRYWPSYFLCVYGP